MLSRSGGMVDAQDSKSCESNLMRVRVPPSVPEFIKNLVIEVNPIFEEQKLGSLQLHVVL